MWLTALLILFAVGAAVGNEDECMAQVYHKCNFEVVKPEIPDTFEDLKRYCGAVRDSIKCMNEKAGKCKVINDVFDLYFNHVAHFIEKNYEEERPLYQALSRNYDCIQPTAKNIGNKCRPSKKEWEDIINLISKEEEFPEREDTKICQRALYEQTCIAHMIGTQCGQEAKEAVTEILRNTKGDVHYCDLDSNFSKIPLYKEVFEAAITKKLEGENDLDLR